MRDAGCGKLVGADTRDRVGGGGGEEVAVEVEGE